VNDTAQLNQTAEMHGSNQHLAQQSAAPLVSIIIPCHNQARFLFLYDAIASVLGQTHSPVELIVVDDGSPDNTAEIARRYEAIRFLCQENRGVSTARNAGFSASTGAYVMFLDADDRLMPNAVQEHLRCFADHRKGGASRPVRGDRWPRSKSR
jgi:glycosyltransferase involved in cell wall biosynthesis